MIRRLLGAPATVRRYSQDSICRSHICRSIGKYCRLIGQDAVMVSLRGQTGSTGSVGGRGTGNGAGHWAAIPVKLR